MGRTGETPVPLSVSAPLQLPVPAPLVAEKFDTVGLMPAERSATRAEAVLRLTLIDGLGPVLIARLIHAFGSPASVLEQSEESLRLVKGVRKETARVIVADRRASADRVAEELARAEDLGVRLVTLGDPEYPPLLTAIPNPPPMLYVRGELRADLDRYTVALVGSRACSAYGIEQAERFAGWLAGAGLTVVSGGARGIDTAAHRAAIRLGGRTIAVLGCGLANVYPPENKELFQEIAAGRGAVVSELPLSAGPNAQNFPMRNRIISGLSLGTLVVEAASGSGALITARHAAEDHGREVFAVPGRIDSPASEGSNDLLKRGGAHLVTAPSDVLDILEAPARHLHAGVHADRYADPTRDVNAELFEDASDGTIDSNHSLAESGLTEPQRAIVRALDEPMPMEELARRLAFEPGALRAEITILEVRRLIERRGQTIARRS